jgi:hypothetical protein
VIKLDEKEGLSLLRNRLLKPAHVFVKAAANFTENPLRPGALTAANFMATLPYKVANWGGVLAEATVGGILDVFIANEAKKIAHERREMYRHFAEGVVSVLDPSFKPAPTKAPYGFFFDMGRDATRAFTDLDLERYQVAIALIRQSCHRGSGGYCPFELKWYKSRWTSSTFLKGMANEYQRNKWSIN